MKLLYCSLCGDIVSPYREALKPRACNCGEYVVWWTDPNAGIIQVHSQMGDKRSATIIGVHNSLLDINHCPTPVDIMAMTKGMHLEGHSLFGKTESLIVRFRPGETDESSWAVRVPQ